MDFLSVVYEPQFFAMVVTPVLIFLARVLDVTIGTMRIIFVSRGVKTLASFIGFFEILVWLVAIAQVMNNLTNFANYIAYAAGFAMGNFMGIYIEDRIAMGYLSVSVVTEKNPVDLIGKLESSGYRTTTMEAKGRKESVQMIFTVIKRKKLGNVLSIVKNFDRNAFYSIEDVKYLHEIQTPERKHHLVRRGLFAGRRKGK